MWKEKEWKKTHYAKSNQKKAGVVILIGNEMHSKKKVSLKQRWSFYNDKGLTH